MRSSLRPLVASFVLAASAVPALAQEYTASSTTGAYVAPPAVGTTTLLATQKDEETVQATLPFEFPFFGRLYTTVSVCSNGWLAFGTTTVKSPANAALPTSAQPNGIVAAVWDDLSTAAAGRVVSIVEGTEPSRVFVVTWLSMDAVATQSGDGVSFQVRLHEGSGLVEIAYDGNAGAWNGLSYTSGIEDPTGTRGFGAGTLGNAQSGTPTLDWRFQPKVVPVTGRLLRDRPVAGTGGLGATTETGLPVAGADVLLVREDTGEAAARGRTAADGGFSATLLGADLPATHEARLLASSDEVRVLASDDTVYVHTFARGILADGAPDVGTVPIGAPVDTVNAPFRRALNIHQAVRRGLVRAADAAAFAVGGTEDDPETFARLDARWNPGAASPDGRTQYVLATFTPATATTPEVRTPPILRVHEGADNPDPWDDDVLLRETALHVLATISRLDPTLPGHTWDAVSSADRAWADGFSHWFASSLQDRAQFIDTTSATAAVVRDLETLADTIPKKTDVTACVAASLWDLVDPANETRDAFDGTRGPAPSTVDEILRAIDRNLDAPSGAVDVGDFFDAWTAGRAPAESRATARVFILHGTLPDDVREANDLAGEETAVAGPAAKVEGLTISPFNEDRFAAAFGGDGTRPLVATVGLAGPVEVDVEVLDAGGAVVAIGTNAGSPDTARVVAETAGPAAAGTYTVRVVWRGGSAAGYSVSFHQRIDVTPATLGEWTAGFAFAQRQDFAATGGIAPYSFALSGLPPGLSSSANGRRLVGTPTAEGTYDVVVDVSDASGPGVARTFVVPLTVNPPLRLARWFAVDSGGAVDVAVGTGGTRANWAPVSAAPPGFTLTGGSTLRVASAGAVTADESFDVTASSVDEVGAEVASSVAHFVICDLLPVSGSVEVPKPGHFGFAFDAFAGARPNLTFRFRGRGKVPRFVAFVDDLGREADSSTARIARSGGNVRVRNVLLPTTGRWYAIFERSGGAAFTGKVSVGGRTDVEREVHGVVVIEDADAFEEISFEASAGSSARLFVRSEEVPNRVLPALGRLRRPDGTDGQKGRRLVRRGGQVVEHPSATIDATGTWRLEIGSDSGSSGPRVGPVYWSVRVKPPKARSFVLFDDVFNDE